MAAHELAPRITVDPEVSFGKPVIKGTRVPVHIVVGHLAGGMTIEEVMAEYDVTREDVLAALKYAADLVADELNDRSNVSIKLHDLLRRTYDLIEDVTSKFDSAPIALADRHDPRHVDKDKEFLDRKDRLKSDIKALLDANWDTLEYDRLKLRLERLTPTVPVEKNPVWEGYARCRCWWDAKDELVEIANYLEGLLSESESPRDLMETVQSPQAEVASLSPHEPYVDPIRIQELSAITSPQFDLTKLIGLCEELNVCFANDCFLAVAVLTRAVLDHVPPIFGFKRFSEVANNYPGSKSFRDSMQHLENSSRKIADAHLHTHIRSSEAVPTRTQVNFSNDLDVLLAEVVRILK